MKKNKLSTSIVKTDTEHQLDYITNVPFIFLTTFYIFDFFMCKKKKIKLSIKFLQLYFCILLCIGFITLDSSKKYFFVPVLSKVNVLSHCNY